jgi:Zn-dependent protease
VVLLFVAAALAGGVLAWRAGFDTGLARLGVFVLVVAGWVVSLSLHEFSHALAAYRAGDRNVETAGYLTLNPFRYAHPVLSVLLPLFFIAQGGIGLPGGAVYLHRHRMRSRAAQSLAAAAGPLTNAACAAVVLAVVGRQQALGGHGAFWSGLAFFGFLQVSATVLNLLPIPGLDGWAIVEPYVSPETAAVADRVKPWGLIGVFVLLQVSQLNTLFFDVVSRLYELSGASPFLWQAGDALFRFWQR